MSKQSTPRKGTETACIAILRICLLRNNLHPARGRKRRSLWLRPNSARNNLHPARGRKLCALASDVRDSDETIYTPQGDGNRLHYRHSTNYHWKQSTPRKGTETLACLFTCQCARETIYTPQGDGNVLILVALGHGSKKQPTPRKGTTFIQRSVMCFERSQRARLLWLPAARHR